jgi:hypothetical protein
MVCLTIGDIPPANSRSQLARRSKNQSKQRGLGDSPIAQEMFKTLQYYWNAARGYRLNPWKSPYVRWRFETFLGKEAADLTARKFVHLAWKYRDHMQRFVDWAAERRRFQRRRHA